LTDDAPDQPALDLPDPRPDDAGPASIGEAKAVAGTETAAETETETATGAETETAAATAAEAAPVPTAVADHRREREARWSARVRDVRRALSMATWAVCVFGPVEYAVTLWAYAGSIGVGSKLRLVALVATLSLWLWAVLAGALSTTLVVVRAARARIDERRATTAGLFELGALTDGIRTNVPKLWGAVVAAGLGAAVMQRGTAWAMTRYKEPQLTAILVAVLAVAVAIAAHPVYRGLAACARAGATALASIGIGVANPLGRWRAASVALAAGGIGATIVVWYVLPQSRSVLPVRLELSALAIVVGAGIGALRATRPAKRPKSRRTALAVAGAGLVIVVMTLLRWGADLETKYVAITASPALDKLIAFVRFTNDLDRDGFGSLLGEGDCAPLSKRIHPGAQDIPSDGIDQNCDGRDFSLADLEAPVGPHVPIPDGFKRDWNILFITIDTVRYDRTTFGGYLDSPAKRDTTPRLAEFAARSTNFAFAIAPSAGTMASIPAVLTSKFFHSGLALDEGKPAGTPPGILPENTTLPEIVKRRGYYTGVIGSHEWWNDWGLDQGVDDYDNSIGKNPDAFRVVADKVTDHILAWVSRNQSRKWFLWAHYIDPHGRYVAHPDVVPWDGTEPDRYDAELRWTDQQVGRLLDELARLPSNDNTIIIITSDHGESMGEHNVPTGTHGIALYQELLHVPLLVYVPNNKPRVVQGAVSALDVVPTVSELVGADTSDLAFEGRSLVPQIFYGKEDPDRIVFAETNAPGKQRAAISQSYKLIYYLSSNLLELFDLKADPLEKTNLAPKAPPALPVMRRALDNWMERVLYAKDPTFNQAYRQLSDVLLTAKPTPDVATPGKTLAGGAIEVLGIGPTNPALGKKTDLHVYLRAVRPTPGPVKLQLVAFPLSPADQVGPNEIREPSVRSSLRPTADGAYASDRWKPGDYIRERFAVNLGPWTTPAIGLAIVAHDGKATETVFLGTLPVQGSAGSATP
jgi:arylsulfatase A-like enzyme